MRLVYSGKTRLEKPPDKSESDIFSQLGRTRRNQLMDLLPWIMIIGGVELSKENVGLKENC